MSRYEQMLSYVPLYYNTSKLYKAILSSEGKEFGDLIEKIEELKAQLFVDTATWGLELWEKELGLSPGTGLTIDGRRSVIKGKMRGIGKVGAELIKTVAEAYTNGEVSVTFDGDIVVTFIGKRGIPVELEQIKAQLQDIVPAHLMLKFVFTYLSWNEFDSLSAAVQESMTWNQLEVYKLL